MGSLLDELERREAAARAEAEELRGRIAELTGLLAQAEERLVLTLAGFSPDLLTEFPHLGRHAAVVLRGRGGSP